MSYKCIGKNAATIIMKGDNCLVVDIRDSRSFDDGHIEGAINLSIDNIDQFASSTNKDSNVIVCCYHGNSSKSVAKSLYKIGFINVSSLIGGYEEWKNNIK